MITTDDTFVIEGYVAKDKDSCSFIYELKPRMSKTINGVWVSPSMDGCVLRIPKEAFPNLEWEDDPIKVELCIKRI